MTEHQKQIDALKGGDALEIKLGGVWLRLILDDAKHLRALIRHHGYENLRLPVLK